MFLQPTKHAINWYDSYSEDGYDMLPETLVKHVFTNNETGDKLVRFLSEDGNKMLPETLVKTCVYKQRNRR